ncbi:MAG TPA: hypothetical protein VNR86_07370 [Sphingomicrobium sp.]|nr:hypothetical protein [Sphingomicrobium sp.]
MKEYRLFFFDGSHRLTMAHEFEADDDVQASRIAESWREGRQMELWQRDRKVRCWGFPNQPGEEQS